MDQFNINILEADIERLSKNVAEKKAAYGNEQISSREVVKESLRPMVIGIGGQNNSGTQVNANDQNLILEEKDILPDYMESSSDELKLQVESLIDLTLKKGIMAGANEAQKRGPFVVDAFHDALTDKLYEILKAKNLI